jgi:hypothetical protein
VSFMTFTASVRNILDKCSYYHFFFNGCIFSDTVTTNLFLNGYSVLQFTKRGFVCGNRIKTWDLSNLSIKFLYSVQKSYNKTVCRPTTNGRPQQPWGIRRKPACRRSTVGIVGSNPAEGMGVRVL